MTLGNINYESMHAFITDILIQFPDCMKEILNFVYEIPEERFWLREASPENYVC